MGRQSDRIGGELQRFVERAIQRVSIETHANLVASPPSGTPVDTGWARSNWVPSVGTPFDGVAGSRPTTSGEGGLDFGQQQLGLARVAASYRLRDGNVFISNNVPYISALNSGSSQQSPAGFVQSAIQKGVASAVRGLRQRR